MKISKSIRHSIVRGFVKEVHVFSEKPNTNKMLLMKMKDEGKTINGVDYD